MTHSPKQTGDSAIDFEAVASDILDVVRPVVEREMREAANQLYGATMEAVQDYLSDNVNFNIRSRLDAAERERRLQWERAEAATTTCNELYEALEAMVADAERIGIEDGLADQADPAVVANARAALSKARPSNRGEA